MNTYGDSYICLHTLTCKGTHSYELMRAQTHTYTYICIYSRTQRLKYTLMNVHTDTHTQNAHAYIPVQKHICIYHKHRHILHPSPIQ